MAEKEIAYIFVGIMLFLLIVFFAFLFTSLSERPLETLKGEPKILQELNEEKFLR
jgi:hypothetical protein